MYSDFIIPFEDARRAALLAERSGEHADEPQAHAHHHDEPPVREEYRLEGLIGGGHFAQAA